MTIEQSLPQPPERNKRVSVTASHSESNFSKTTDPQYKDKQPPELVRHRKKHIATHTGRDETLLGHVDATKDAYHVISKLQGEMTDKHPHTAPHWLLPAHLFAFSKTCSLTMPSVSPKFSTPQMIVPGMLTAVNKNLLS